MLRKMLLLPLLMNDSDVETVAKYASDYKFAIFTDIDKLVSTFGADELFKYYTKDNNFNLKHKFFVVGMEKGIVHSTDNHDLIRNIISRDTILAQSHFGWNGKALEDMDRFDEFIMDELGE